MGIRDLIGKGAWPSRDPHFSIGFDRDAFWQNTKLLIQPTPTDTVAKDLSKSQVARTITSTGGNVIVSTQKRFGTYSLRFSRANLQHLTVTPFDDLGFGTDLFTIHAWVYFVKVSLTEYICCSGLQADENTYGFYVNTLNKLCFRLNGATSVEVQAPGTVAAGQWHHVAVERINSTTIRVYLDGVGTSLTIPSSKTFTANQFLIGYGGLADSNLDAYLDAFQVVRGRTMFGADFIPPGLVSTEPPPSQDSELRTSGNQILDASGKSVRFTGVNWSGAEHDGFIPGGLHTRSYKSMLQQMKSLGFNLVRIPYSDDMVVSTSTTLNYEPTLNPELVGKTPIEVLDAIVDHAATLGIAIVLDHHRTTAGSSTDGDTMDHGLWYDAVYTEQEVIDNWLLLANRYKEKRNVIGADLHNEPHTALKTLGLDNNLTWGQGGQDWASAAERIANAIHTVAPHWLIFVEGVENVYSPWQATVGTTWLWGSNLSGARVGRRPINLNIPNKVVYSAHDFLNDYPTAVSGHLNFPNNLPAVWSSLWGWAMEGDIAPVFLGAFGARMNTQKEADWVAQLMSYCNGDFNDDGTTDLGTGKLGVHFAYWSWGPESAEFGGILSDDWNTVAVQRYDRIKNFLYGGQINFGGSVAGPGQGDGDTTVYTTIIENETFTSQQRFEGSTFNNTLVRNCKFLNVNISTGAVLIKGVQNFRFEGNTIDGVTGGAGLYFSATEGTNNVWIVNNDILNVDKQGIFIPQRGSGGSVSVDHTALRLLNNRVSKTGRAVDTPGTVHGIDCQATDVLLQGNTVVDSYDGDGINVSSSCTLKTNRVERPARSGIAYVAEHVAGSGRAILMDGNEVYNAGFAHPSKPTYTGEAGINLRAIPATGTTQYSSLPVTSFTIKNSYLKDNPTHFLKHSSYSTGYTVTYDTTNTEVGGGTTNPPPGGDTTTGLLFQCDFPSSTTYQDFGFFPTGTTIGPFETYLGQGVAHFILTTSSSDPGRTELTVRGVSGWGGAGQYMRVGSEYWIGYRLLLPSNRWTAVDTDDTTLFQFHQWPDSGDNAGRNPPMNLQTLYSGGQEIWNINSRGDDRKTFTDKNYKWVNQKQFDAIAPFFDKWVSWVFHVKWGYSPTQSPFLRVYRDGVKLWEHNEPNCYNDDSGGPYIKIGMYKPDGWGGPTRRDTYVDYLRVANNTGSYTVVDPKILTTTSAAAPAEATPTTTVSTLATTTLNEDPNYNGPDPNEPGGLLTMNFESGAIQDDGVAVPRGKSIQIIGTPTIIPSAHFRVGGAGLRFYAAGDRLSVPDSADWAFGTGLWCLEAMVSFDRTGAGVIVSHGLTSSNVAEYGWVLQRNSSGYLEFKYKRVSDGTIQTAAGGAIPLSVGQPYYVLVYRGSTSFWGFVNSTQTFQHVHNSAEIANPAQPLTVGGWAGNNTNEMMGKVYGLRISTGTNRSYTTSANRKNLTSFPIEG